MKELLDTRYIIVLSRGATYSYLRGEEEVSRDDDNKKIGKLTDILGTTPCTQLRLAC